MTGKNILGINDLVKISLKTQESPLLSWSSNNTWDGSAVLAGLFGVIAFVNTNSSFKIWFYFHSNVFLFFRTRIAWIHRFKHDWTILSNSVLASTFHKTLNCILFCLNTELMLCFPEVCPYREAYTWVRYAESKKNPHFSWYFSLLINQFY